MSRSGGSGSAKELGSSESATKGYENRTSSCAASKISIQSQCTPLYPVPGAELMGILGRGTA